MGGWGDWAGDWSDWGGDRSDWGADWGADYAYMALLTGAERRMLYTPYEPPKQEPYRAKKSKSWFEDVFGRVTGAFRFREVTGATVFGDARMLDPFFSSLRAGIPALTIFEAATGVSKGMEYHRTLEEYRNKVSGLQERKKSIERLMEQGVQQGKAEWVTEDGERKLVVKDEKLYNLLEDMISRYNYAAEEAGRLEEKLKSMEKEITPPYSARDYPVIGKQLYEAEKSAVEWLREKTGPFGAAGQFVSGVGAGIIGLVETPAFLSSLVTKPETIGASMTVHALENPAEFAGTLVGAAIGGKAVGFAVGRGAGVIGRGVETVRSALTEPRPVKQTVIVGGEVVYEGKPLNRPLITESTRIVDMEPVNIRVEKSAVEYQGFRAEMTEVESGVTAKTLRKGKIFEEEEVATVYETKKGAELNVAATPVRAAKVETVEPAWKITLRKPAEIKTITEYQSVIGKLKGEKHVVVSETRGGETTATLFKNLRSNVAEEIYISLPEDLELIYRGEIGGVKTVRISAETVKRIKSKVLEEFELPESDTAVITRPKSETKVRPKTPFKIDSVVRERLERARAAREAKEAKEGTKAEAEARTTTIKRQEGAIYVPRTVTDVTADVAADVVATPKTTPKTSPILPALSLTGPQMRLPALTVFRPNIQLRPEDVYEPISKPKPELKPKPEEETKEFPIISIVPYVAPIVGGIPKVEPKVTPVVEPRVEPRVEPVTISLPAPTPPFYLPMLTLPQFPSGGRLPPTGRGGGKDWWTGLMAGFNVLSRYELAGLAEGRKGVHMLIPEIARPYWERFLLSPGFASIPVAQQMVGRKGRRKKRGKKKKRKRRR